jgi:hypothetical protein
MTTREKTRIIDKIRAFIPSMSRLTRRSRRVAPSSTEVSVQVRLAQRIKEHQETLATIEKQIIEYTTKYNDERAEALSANKNGDKKTALKHIKYYKMFENHLITTLEVKKLNTVKLITKAEIEKIQNALKTVSSIDEHQVLLNIIKADIVRYTTDYENIAGKKEEALSNIKKGDALNAYERSTNEITQKYVNLYTMYKNMYSNHLKSLKALELITEELRNQKATGSETARDAPTSRNGGKIMRKSKRRIRRIRKTRRHKI